MPTESPEKPKESPKRPKDDRARVEIHPSIVAKISELLPEHQSDRPLSFVVNDLLAEQLKTRVDNTNTLSGPPGHYSYSSSSNSLEGLESVRGRETFLTPVSENFVCHKPNFDIGRATADVLAEEEKRLNEELEARYKNEKIDEIGYENHQKWIEDQKKSLKKDSPAFQVFWEVYQASPSRAHNQSKSKARTAWKEALKTEKAENLIEAAKRAVKDQARKIGADEWVAPFPDAHRWLRDECFALWLEDITVEQPQEIIPGVTAL